MSAVSAGKRRSWGVEGGSEGASARSIHQMGRASASARSARWASPVISRSSNASSLSCGAGLASSRPGGGAGMAGVVGAAAGASSEPTCGVAARTRRRPGRRNGALGRPSTSSAGSGRPNQPTQSSRSGSQPCCSQPSRARRSSGRSSERCGRSGWGRSVGAVILQARVGAIVPPASAEEPGGGGAVRRLRIRRTTGRAAGGFFFDSGPQGCGNVAEMIRNSPGPSCSGALPKGVLADLPALSIRSACRLPFGHQPATAP